MRVQQYGYGRNNSGKKGFGQKRSGWWLLLLLLGVPAAIALFVGIFWYAVAVLPSVEDAQAFSFAESTIIYDRGALEPDANPSEHILYVVHGDENRDYVPLEEISPWVPMATMAIEDDAFYDHIGIDFGGLFKAILSEVGIGSPRGGSTITQQLIKNTFLHSGRTWSRKAQEILLAVKMERAYTKNEILELYLNKIPYGNNAYGIEAAANVYFAKSARDLTLVESAVLASLPVAPTRFNPYGQNRPLLMGFEKPDGTWGKGRKDLVLERMLDLEMITQEQYEEAFELSKELLFERAVEDIRAPHFVFWVREQVAQKYGEDILSTGGLRIYTTLDPVLQTAAEEVVAERTEDYYQGFRASNAALMAMNPQNGEILAYMGGRDFFAEDFDGQVDVLQSYRQPGSSFKPFVYGAAFEKGYSPATVTFDVETDFGGNYTPQNYDGTFEGPVSAREALNRSLNIPSIKMAYLADPKDAITFSQQAGINFADAQGDHGVALGVGVAEVRPMSMISGYQVWAGDGSYYAPTGILEVHDARGNVLEQDDPESRKEVGVSPVTAALVRNILTDESTRPPSWNRYLQIDGVNNGAKTGTTNRGTEPSDSWTIGFSPALVSGVWVGNNDGRTMVGGATGLAMAAPIWKNFNERAHTYLKDQLEEDESWLYNEPVLLAPVEVNKLNGLRATEDTPEHLRVEEYFSPENVPQESDNSLTTVEIDTITGDYANETTPDFARGEAQALSLQSIVPTKANWQNPVERWMRENGRFVLSLGLERGEFEERDQRELDALYAEKRLETLQYEDLYPTEPGPNAFPDYETNDLKEGAPTVKIITPVDGEYVSDDLLTVRFSPRAQEGIANVVIFVEDAPKRQLSVAPWQTRVNVAEQMRLGQPFTLRAVVTDTKGQVGESSVEILPQRTLEFGR